MNAWPWKLTSYNTQTCGAYAVTKHVIPMTPPKHEYFAWCGGGCIGSYDTAADAKAACVAHNEGVK